MIDHASTYRSRSPWHWHHRARLRALIREVRTFKDASSIADIGCSNGYITNLLNATCTGEVCGYDYLPDLIAEAQRLYPHIRFQCADLNRVVRWKRQFDVVCCFETLEHVGDLESALKNIRAAVRQGGVLIVSVPVETGMWGLVKFCGKTLMGYPLDEINATRVEYFQALLTRKDVSKFRRASYTWGTHYGFDWRHVQDCISADLTVRRAYTKYATRIIVAQKL